jgi:hypothetical protein
MQEENTHLSAEQARHLTQHGVNQNEDGTYSWKFDNYVRGVVPYDMRGRDTPISGRVWPAPPCSCTARRAAPGIPPRTDARGNFPNARVIGWTAPATGSTTTSMDVFLKTVREFLA